MSFMLAPLSVVQDADAMDEDQAFKLCIILQTTTNFIDQSNAMNGQIDGLIVANLTRQDVIATEINSCSDGTQTDQCDRVFDGDAQLELAEHQVTLQRLEETKDGIQREVARFTQMRQDAQELLGTINCEQ